MDDHQDEVEMDHRPDGSAVELVDEAAGWWRRARAAWKAGPVRIVVMLAVATAVNFGVNGYTINRLSDEAAQSCHDRREARESVRQLVIVAVGNVPPGRSVVADQLRASLAPGGSLEEIACR